MRIVAISDTHNQQHGLRMPAGDCLIVAGDLTGSGNLNALNIFANWLKEQDYRYKIVIAGNHDFCFENELAAVARQMIKDAGGIYLENSGCELEGIKFWGSPYTPRFFDWAFNVDRGSSIRRHWDLIPADTNVLITHGPPYGILDAVHNHRTHGERVGCHDLLARLEGDLNLDAHFFGHIHCAHGSEERTNARGKTTRFMNCAVLSEAYKVTNGPTVWDTPTQVNRMGDERV